jgi:hypothetical protein
MVGLAIPFRLTGTRLYFLTSALCYLVRPSFTFRLVKWILFWEVVLLVKSNPRTRDRLAAQVRERYSKSRVQIIVTSFSQPYLG